MSVGPTVGFGKVPRMGDFVRVRANTEPTASFEGWIQEAVAYGEAKRTHQWPTIYGQGAIHAFVFRPPAKTKPTSVLAGVFRPSVDAVNRRFPLVIGASLDAVTVAPGPHLLPLVLGDFFEETTQALMGLDVCASLQEFEARVTVVQPPRLDSAPARSREYEGWAMSTPQWMAWGTVYGQAESRQAIHAIQTIIDCFSTLRGVEPPTTPLSVRVPLGGGGVAAAAFWIDVVRRIARWRSTVPTFFLHFDGYKGWMLVQLGDTPHSSLLELFAPDPGSDHVCDLMGNATFDPDRILARMPPAIAQVLADPSRPVGDLLNALAQ
jgi:type VI secretion system ImpM family protein